MNLSKLGSRLELKKWTFAWERESYFLKTTSNFDLTDPAGSRCNKKGNNFGFHERTEESFKTDTLNNFNREELSSSQIETFRF